MGQINRCSASLRIKGYDLDPDYITELFGCTPSHTARRGDIKRNKKGEILHVFDTGYWSLGYDQIDSTPLEEKIETLLAKVTDDMGVWKEVTKVFKAELFCGIFLGAFNEGFEISAGLVNKISARHIALGFDIYDNPNKYYF